MVYVVFAVILSLFAVAGLVGFAATKKMETIGLTLTALVVLGIFTLFCSMTTVGARAVGIQTSFGRYDATLGQGFQWKPPWASVEEFPTFIQTMELRGTRGNENERGGQPVSYNGGGKGVADATLRWSIDQENAEALWRNFRSFDRVQNDLVETAAREAVRIAVGSFTATQAQSGDNTKAITDKVRSELTASLSAKGIKLDSVSVTGVFLDDETQASVSKVVQAQQDKARAQVEQEKAEIEAETAKIREKSGSLSDAALRRYCLEVTNSWDNGKNGPLPATWNCLTTPASPVLVGGR